MDKVLSQAEIDAMLSGRLEEPASPLPEIPDPPRVAKVTVSSISAPAQLAKDRLAEYERALQGMTRRISEMEKALEEARAFMAQVQQGLQATPGYGVQKSFTCKSCKGHNYVAMPVKCTQCGDVTWWGWYPPKK